jgi:hypothetical protein
MRRGEREESKLYLMESSYSASFLQSFAHKIIIAYEHKYTPGSLLHIQSYIASSMDEILQILISHILLTLPLQNIGEKAFSLNNGVQKCITTWVTTSESSDDDDGGWWWWSRRLKPWRHLCFRKHFSPLKRIAFFTFLGNAYEWSCRRLRGMSPDRITPLRKFRGWSLIP